MKEAVWSEAVLRYTLMVDGDPKAATEAMLLEVVSKDASFEDVVQYMVCNADNCFDERTDCGKLLIGSMVKSAEERALRCDSFQGAYLVYCTELEPVHSRTRRMNYHDVPSLKYLVGPLYRRVVELADRQIQAAKQTMDIPLLVKMYESAQGIKGFYNFHVPFKNGILEVVQHKLEMAIGLSELVGLYQEAKNANCKLARESIGVAIAEFLLNEEKNGANE